MLNPAESPAVKFAVEGASELSKRITSLEYHEKATTNVGPPTRSVSSHPEGYPTNELRIVPFAEFSKATPH